MEINFERAIAALGGAAGVLRLANQMRPPADYLLATLFPERPRASYTAEDGAMIVRPTMAGLVGMDSKYPEGGIVDVNTFAETIAKMAMQVNLSEKMRRELREAATIVFLRPASEGGGQAGVDRLVEQFVLNFVNKLLLQPLMDRGEWLRGQVVTAAAIAWTFNGSSLTLDYLVPSANKFATRTGTAAYGGTASVWWADVKAARRLLKGSLRIALGHSDTIDAIIYNNANAINVLADEGGRVQIQRYRGSLERPSTDARETMTLVRYDKEGEVFDPTTPGATKKLPFVPPGTITFIAEAGANDEFAIGEGATPDPDNSLELGYTHLGPTEENNGALGRWSRVYTPEDMPMQLRGQSAENSLPVLRAKDKLVIASTVLS